MPASARQGSCLRPRAGLEDSVVVKNGADAGRRHPMTPSRNQPEQVRALALPLRLLTVLHAVRLRSQLSLQELPEEPLHPVREGRGAGIPPGNSRAAHRRGTQRMAHMAI